MGWSGGSAASIGFDTDGSFYQNHFLSRSINARDVACSNSPDTEWSFLIYQLRKLDSVLGDGSIYNAAMQKKCVFFKSTNKEINL